MTTKTGSLVSHVHLTDPSFYLLITFFLDPPGLLRLQSIFQDLSVSNESFRIDVVKQISSANETLNILREIETTNR